MNWAYQMLRNTPDVEQWVAAPWMVRNGYFDDDFRFFVRDVQRKTGLLSTDERSFSRLSTSLIGLERYYPLYKNWLKHRLLNDPPDLIHAHFGPVGCNYLDLAQQLGIPLIVSFYGYDFQRVPFEKPFYRQRYRDLFREAAMITCTGPYTSKFLEAQGCPPEKITPVPLGIPLEDFPYQERTKLPAQLKMVQVATITEKKGQLDSLEALRLALAKRPNLHLTLAGEKQDKSLVEKIDNFIKTNQLQKHVTWLDAIPHENLASFLGKFDVFIHPSRHSAQRDCEGSPVVILEAQATGLPVVATTHADIPAQVRQGITGLLTDENDLTALMSSIERFYDMGAAEYGQFSRAARKQVEQYFDVKLTGNILRTAYERAL